jgi:aminoglycoside 3-N-acetyltransferase
MKEKDVILKTNKPSTLESLVIDLENLGLKSTDTCIAHISMSKIGFVVGAQRTIIDALQSVLNEGTLVMPAQSGDLSNPSEWENPPVPLEWVETIKNHTPAFDVHKTPTRSMGRVAELFRTYPSVYRSNHPQVSFSAWGCNAKEITNIHALTPMFGNDSPLKRLYDIDAKILMIGTDYETVTALHHAEFLAKNRPLKNQMSYILENNIRKTVTFEDYDYDNEDFNEIGQLFEKTHDIKFGYIGDAKSKLISLKKLIDTGFSYYLKINI